MIIKFIKTLPDQAQELHFHHHKPYLRSSLSSLKAFSQKSSTPAGLWEASGLLYNSFGVNDHRIQHPFID